MINYLSIIVVSYNVCDLLRNCLRSIFTSAAHSADWLHVNVIVVDNASTDGSAEMVAAEFPNVTLIASKENLGFTGGNNLALQGVGFGEKESARCATQSAVYHSPLLPPPQPRHRTRG